MVPNVQKRGRENYGKTGLKGTWIMFRSVFIVIAFFLGAFHLAAAPWDEQATPAELVQYVRKAQAAGINIPQIRQDAVKAGWPEGMVDRVIESVSSKSKPAADTTATPATSNPPGDSTPEKAGKPAAFEMAAGTPLAKISGAAPAPASGVPAGGDPASVKAKAADGSLNSDYTIGEGDVLQVVVWGEPNASVQSATVRPDGKITMPLIKEVVVAGLTPAQVETVAQEQLSKLIQTADVTVIVAQINSKKIFLTGAVRKEGPLKYTYKMTVLQAISEAGGLTDYAKKKNIYVLHTENGIQYRFPFNYISVLKGENIEQNILLSPGDTIVVP
jgi:polysaccharide export outer membrane protein